MVASVGAQTKTPQLFAAPLQHFFYTFVHLEQNLFSLSVVRPFFFLGFKFVKAV